MKKKENVINKQLYKYYIPSPLTLHVVADKLNSSFEKKDFKDPKKSR